jgi:hypothetical protein
MTMVNVGWVEDDLQDMALLREVIPELEVAKKGSPELDRKIAEALRHPGGIPFTQSLDAAWALLPSPLGSMSVATTFGLTGFADDRRGEAWVGFDTSMAGSSFMDSFKSKAATLALAFCAAALKARVSGQAFKARV